MKTLDNFYKDSSAVFNRATSCAECRRISSAQFRADNRDYFKKYLQQNRESIQKVRKQWTKANYMKASEYAARTKEKLRGAMDRLLPEDTEYKQQIDEAPHTCPITGSVEVELDHVLPISRGNWGNNRGNLMYLHKPLNTSKSNRNVFKWLEQIEQPTLDYLLPDGVEMTVQEFRVKYLEVLQQKAAEKEMTLEQYKEEYYRDYEEE